MLDENAWEAVAERVIDNDFYQQQHRLIFRAVEQLVAEEQFVDLVTVAAKLEELGVIEQAGGRAYLNSLTNSIPSAENCAAYADIVRERSQQRRLINAASQIMHTAYEPEGNSTLTMLSDAEKAIRSEEHTSELQSRPHLVCRLLLEKKK